MRCPKCDGKSYCLDSRPTEEGNYTRRRRECKACGHRFTTLEVIASEARGPISAEMTGRRMLRAMEEAVVTMQRLLTPRDAEKDDETCPDCKAPLIVQWSGVKCSKCSYWFCY